MLGGISKNSYWKQEAIFYLDILTTQCKISASASPCKQMHIWYIMPQCWQRHQNIPVRDAALRCNTGRKCLTLLKILDQLVTTRIILETSKSIVGIYGQLNSYFQQEMLNEKNYDKPKNKLHPPDTNIINIILKMFPVKQNQQ